MMMYVYAELRRHSVKASDGKQVVAVSVLMYESSYSITLRHINFNVNIFGNL